MAAPGGDLSQRQEPVIRRPALGFAVVMRAAASRQKAKAVQRPEPVGKRIGQSLLEPANRPGPVVEGDRALGRAASLRAERVRLAGRCDVERPPLVESLIATTFCPSKVGLALVDERAVRLRCALKSWVMSVSCASAVSSPVAIEPFSHLPFRSCAAAAPANLRQERVVPFTYARRRCGRSRTGGPLRTSCPCPSRSCRARGRASAASRSVRAPRSARSLLAFAAAASRR